MRECGIGNEGVPDRISKARGLDLQMETVGPERIETFHRKAIEDIQKHQRRQALPRWWNLEEIDATVMRMDRIDIGGGEIGEIAELMPAALCVQKGNQ